MRAEFYHWFSHQKWSPSTNKVDPFFGMFLISSISGLSSSLKNIQTLSKESHTVPKGVNFASMKQIVIFFTIMDNIEHLNLLIRLVVINI